MLGTTCYGALRSGSQVPTQNYLKLVNVQLRPIEIKVHKKTK